MKKTNKIFRILSVLLLVITSFAVLVGCGKPETYVFSVSEFKSDVIDMPLQATIVINNAFKGATLSVGKKKVTLTLGDSENTMSYTKEGEKYILAGEYVDRAEEMLKYDLGVEDVEGLEVEYTMYGIKTESGFDIVSALKIGSAYETDDIEISVTYKFVKKD